MMIVVHEQCLLLANDGRSWKTPWYLQALRAVNKKFQSWADEWSYCRVTKCFCEARKAAGLPQMTSHTLRHFFISQAIMSNDVSTFTIAKWVGHRGTRMIEEVYGHLRSGYRQ